MKSADNLFDKHRSLSILAFLCGTLNCSSVFADGSFQYSFDAVGDTRTAEDVSLRLRWSPEISTESVKVSLSLIDQWNYDPNDGKDSSDYLHGTYLGAQLDLGDPAEGLSFSSQLSAGRYKGLDAPETSTGLAGAFNTRYSFPSSETIRFAALAGISVTSKNYIGLEEVTEENDDDDPFADSGWTEVSLGGEISYQNYKFSLAAVTESPYKDGSNRLRQHGADLELSYYRQEQANSGQISFLWPTSAYATVEYREIDFGSDTSLRNDQNTTLNLSSYWEYGATQITLDYEYYFYNTRNRSFGFEDYKGSSLDFSIGYYGNPWSVYFYASANKENATGSTSGTDTRDLDASLSFFYDPGNIPKIEMNFSHYQFDGDYSGTRFDTQKQSISLGIDVLDFLDRPKEKDASLFLSLKFVREKTFDSFTDPTWRTDDNVVIGFDFSLLSV
ncbi:hypothetical protein [Tateyamaria pelophila]|uniref:hypothetical protein n=1 Tax=Tateyamaria pelophila TaxID=328415 RepID=UPI001CBF55BC|nr:hypothetical protein [Tateyamaria pelophila]